MDERSEHLRSEIEDFIGQPFPGTIVITKVHKALSASVVGEMTFRIYGGHVRKFVSTTFAIETDNGAWVAQTALHVGDELIQHTSKGETAERVISNTILQISTMEQESEDGT